MKAASAVLQLRLDEVWQCSAIKIRRNNSNVQHATRLGLSKSADSQSFLRHRRRQGASKRWEAAPCCCQLASARLAICWCIFLAASQQATRLCCILRPRQQPDVTHVDTLREKKNKNKNKKVAQKNTKSFTRKMLHVPHGASQCKNGGGGGTRKVRW